MGLSKRSAPKGMVEYLEYSARMFILDEMDFVEQARRIAPNLSKGSAAVYILRLVSGALYIGSTLDLPQRMADPIAGIGCKTTHDDRPQSLLLVEPHPTFSAARKREAQINRWTRAWMGAIARHDLESLRLLSKSRG
jgi:predicted GIY-YIG superfamily endonuclease